MKKLITLAAAVISAALFFGCSDSSDNNNAALLLAASNSGSSRVSLPASVGTNELKGKTFKLDTFNSIEFSDSYYVEKNTVAGISTCNKYVYTYNSDTKSLYSYYLDGYMEGDFDSATTMTDEEYEALVKSFRYSTYSPYGYTDTTNETEVSAEIKARFERDMLLKFNVITRQAYNLSLDGSTLKLTSDSRYPQGVTLADIYSPAYSRDVLSIVNNSVTSYTLNYSGQYVWPERNAAIMSSNYLSGCKVSSVTSDAINLSAVGTRSSTDEDFTYSSVAFNFVYDTTDITNGVKYTLKNSETDVTIGEITINYAASTNVPDMTSATSYTLVTE